MSILSMVGEGALRMGAFVGAIGIFLVVPALFLTLLPVFLLLFAIGLAMGIAGFGEVEENDGCSERRG